MIDLQRTEKRVFSGNAEDGYRAFFGALEALDIEPRLAPAEATRVVGVLTTLYARHSLSAARFEQVIGHGATLRHIIARSGFQSAAHLLGVVATQGADGSHRIEKPDQLEKLLSLSSVKHTPATLLGLIPKLRPQAALQVSLLLLSDPDIAQAPQIRAFVQGLAGLFEQLEVNDALIPIFGPAFQGADSFADPASIRRALQSTLGRWVAAQDWPPFSGNNEDGPKVVVSAEALEGRGDDTVFFGPYDHVPGYVRTERATPPRRRREVGGRTAGGAESAVRAILGTRDAVVAPIVGTPTLGASAV